MVRGVQKVGATDTRGFLVTFFWDRGQKVVKKGEKNAKKVEKSEKNAKKVAKNTIFDQK